MQRPARHADVIARRAGVRSGVRLLVVT